MQYREIRHIRDSMDQVHRPLREAILANDTREMTLLGGRAQAAADELVRRLDEASQRRDNSIEGASSGQRIERVFVQAAISALERAVAQAQRIGLATNVAELRASLLEVKTHGDFADAYLRAALGIIAE